jgi:hypothetical protein
MKDPAYNFIVLILIIGSGNEDKDRRDKGQVYNNTIEAA